MDLTDKLNAMRNGEELPQEDLEVNQVETEEQPQVEEGIETAPEETEEQPQVEQAVEEIQATEPEKWEPRLKYKVLKEEHDFPDWSKELVTSKELEDQFVDLLTRANALEHQKKRRGEVEDDFAKLQTTYDANMADARELASFVSDVKTKIESNNPAEQMLALQSAGLNEKQILEVARHVLDLQKLTPTQRSAYDQQFTQRDQLSQYEQKLSQAEQSLQLAQIQNAKAELTSYLAGKADLRSEYEAREGNNEGDFQNDFFNFGVALQQKLGKQVEYKDAMKEFKKIHGLGRAKSKPAPKVLPNLRSTGHSPVEKAFSTMDDLRKYMGSKY